MSVATTGTADTTGGTDTTAKTEGTQDAKTSTLLPDADVDTQEEQTAETGEKKPASEAASTERAAPDKYEFKAPDGVVLDSEVVGKFEAVARELKMPQAEAQKVIETMAPVFKSQAAALLDKQAKVWASEAKADKEYGGEKLTESLAIGERAIAQFGDDTFRSLLVQTKLANHPAVIRFMVKAGKALSPDSVETGNAGDKPHDNSNAAKAKRMYPTMPN